MWPEPRNIMFELTEQHIKLLRHMYVGWQDCETGAPEINPKRPYGNRTVAEDIADILGIEVDGGAMPEAMRKGLMKLHEETAHALQIVLVTGEFEPGIFMRDEIGRRGWKRITEAEAAEALLSK